VVKIFSNKLFDICTQILIKVGLCEEDATVVADNIVKGELRGVESHGIIQIFPFVERIQKNLINLKPKIKITNPDSSFISIDADNGLGQVIALKAIDLALKKAKDTGCCIVSTFNTNYLGMLSYYSLQIADNDMIGFITCSSPPAMAPTGGIEAKLGTNPFCFAIPTGKEYPIVLDMATSSVAKGKIRLALKKNEKIPEGWALDKEGLSTTDPKAALEGVLFPLGGYKGYGLGLMVDIFSGVLSGANFSTKITNPLYNMDTSPNLGNFIMVIDIGNSMPVGKFKRRINELIEGIKSSKKMSSISEIFIPGEIEFRTEMKRLEEGIPISNSNYESIRQQPNKFHINL
jgi:LDH2 family malate/lactate/ureidoglycolate dehydrogenase